MHKNILTTYTITHPGICVNCRNGTEGDHCENCSPNVEGAQCDLCTTGFYWSPLKTCVPCACHPVGSVDVALCTPDGGGACQCHPFVTGRACDRCQDNYVNVSVTGCTPCSLCYSLVADEIVATRELSDNTTTLFSNRTGAATTRASFTSAAVALSDRLNALISYMAYVRQNNASILATIVELTAAYSLESDVNRNFSLPHLNGTSSAILADINATMAYIDATIARLGTDNHAGNLMNYDLIRPLAERLNATLTSLREIADRYTSKVDAVLKQSATVQRNQQQSGNITRLAQSMIATTSTSITEASDIYVLANDNLSKGNARLSSLAGVVDSARNNVEVCENRASGASRAWNRSVSAVQGGGEGFATAIDSARNSAYEINIESLRNNQNAPSRQVETAAARTAELATRTAAYNNESRSLAERGSSTRAMAAAAGISEVKGEAEHMSDVMREFGTRSEAMRRRVNESLGVVSTIHDLSARVYNASMTLKLQLETLRLASERSVASIELASGQSSAVFADEISRRLNDFPMYTSRTVISLYFIYVYIYLSIYLYFIGCGSIK